MATPRTFSLSISTRHGYLYDAALCARALGQALLALGDASGRIRLVAASERFASIGAKPELERTRRAIASLGQ